MEENFTNLNEGVANNYQGSVNNNFQNANNNQLSYDANDWRANLPSEYQQTASKFNSPEALLKAYIGAESLIGKKVSDFSQYDWQTYSAMMQQHTGIPADVTGYDIRTDNQINSLSDEEVTNIKYVAHDLQLNNEQAQKLYDYCNEMTARQDETMVNQAVDGFQTLAQMWGNAYQSKLQAVDTCVNSLLPQLTGLTADQIKEELDGVWMSPPLLNLLATIGELSMDSGSRGYNNITPMDASVRLEQLKSDPETQKILTNPHDPRYKSVQAELRSLIAMKNCEGY